jgi:L-fuculose-phosphate aldolase
MKHAAYRRTVLELSLELSRRGYFAATGGNIAVRIDAQMMAVTPSATDYLTMSAADVCVLRIADLQQVDGERTPTVESSLHARVLQARPDVHASIHTHQPTASACALLGRELPVPPELQRSLGTRIPVAGYAPSGSAWLSAKVARLLRPDINAYLMLNHGVLCCGTDAQAGMQVVEDLETLACTHLRAQIAARAARDPSLSHALALVAEALLAPSSPNLQDHP